MSGTSYGACVLHVSPEAYVGGPLALVRNGDPVELNVERRSLNILVSAQELADRRRTWTAPQPQFERGYARLYQRHVSQADKGCDFDFLEPA
jgi:dihydroxy-acid dehydratase